MATHRRWRTSASPGTRPWGMLQLDLAPYPTVKRVFTTAMAIPAFAKAHPLAQPDTPAAMRPKPA